MNRLEHIALLASYNTWMNDKLYGAARQAGDVAIHQDMRAFFGSIFGTLNHLVVADSIWLGRFSRHPAGFAALEWLRSVPAPTSLDQAMFPTFEALSERRVQLDQTFTALAAELRDEHLDSLFEYTTTKGIHGVKSFHGVLMHVFNHQTHHRGQATTLLTQLGIDVGATDLLLLL